MFVPVTRKELLSALHAEGIYNSHPIQKDHKLWQEAVHLYKTETKDHDVSLACGSCVVKVKRWLER